MSAPLTMLTAEQAEAIRRSLARAWGHARRCGCAECREIIAEMRAIEDTLDGCSVATAEGAGLGVHGEELYTSICEVYRCRVCDRDFQRVVKLRRPQSFAQAAESAMSPSNAVTLHHACFSEPGTAGLADLVGFTARRK